MTVGDFPAGQYRKFEGMRCAVVGRGSPLILIHGFGESMLVWRKLVQDLAKSHEVHLFDLLGHGEADKPVAGKFDPQSHADRLYRYIMQFRLVRPVIVGHSMGGGVGLLLGVRLRREAEGNLGGLILLDTMFYNQKVPVVVRAMRLKGLGRFMVRIAPAHLASRLTLNRVIRDRSKITKEMVAIYSQSLCTREGRIALVRTAEQIVLPPGDRGEKEISAIDVPTLLIWGEFDTIVAPEIGARIHALIASSRLEIIKNCGHCPNEEHPAETLALMNEFLSSLPQLADRSQSIGKAC